MAKDITSLAIFLLYNFGEKGEYRMAKQNVSVNFSFTADVTQAKKQIRDLQQSLQEVAKLPGTTNKMMFDDAKLKAASQAALELQQHLQAAINVDTGKLDLSKFSSSLKSSNKDLNTYCDQLMKIGSQGQEAFLKLAKSISLAEAPTARVSKRMQEFLVTLKNTAKWQISSSLLHGFMGSIQSAYSYAQDLNESLNKIRIVTGQSVDQMAEFAKQANESAKALSTTTTAYTDAALIFYQQGLGDSDVKARTDAVIKMANVTGDAASDVSSYMTAIWNNYAKGADNLEHFGDVITALGATTASSSSEIAEGLEKFAAIGDTIGLSYDYATSILSALVANTRQSADVIGTSLRTIFARLQGLSLGETLDDGVTLNKYSKALKTVGVDIIDTTGSLKGANTILDETAKRWGQLSDAQQTALAQTVAGTRQYAQFIAMMENWGDVQNNVLTAQNADGTLDEQAKIYEESWEAARDRVKAAAEELYNTLLDDKFFIKLNDMFSGSISIVNDLIQGLGGVKSVLAIISSFILNTIAVNLPDRINTIKLNLIDLFDKTGKATTEIQEKINKELTGLQRKASDNNALSFRIEGYKQLNIMQQNLIKNANKMTESEKENYKIRMNLVDAMYQEVSATAKLVDETNKERASVEKEVVNSNKNYYANLNKERNDLSKKNSQLWKEYIAAEEGTKQYKEGTKGRYDAEASARRYKSQYDKNEKRIAEIEDIQNSAKSFLGVGNKTSYRVIDSNFQKQFTEAVTAYKEVSAAAAEYGEVTRNIDEKQKQLNGSENLRKDIQAYIDSLKKYPQVVDDAKQKIEELEKVLNNSASTDEEVKKKLEELFSTIREGGEKSGSDSEGWNQAREKIYEIGEAAGKSREQIDELLNSIDEETDAQARLAAQQANIEKFVNNGIEKTAKLSTNFAKLGSTMLSVTSAVNSISSAFDVFKDKASTTQQKITAFVSAVSSSGYALASILQKDGVVMTYLPKAVSGIAGAVTSLAPSITGIAATVIGISGTLAIIAAVIGAIAGIVYLIQKAHENSLEGRLEKAKEEAKELKTALEEVKSEVQDLKSDFDEYDDVIEKLNSCAKGTQEWRDALQDVNDKVFELIEKYPELKEYLQFENGNWSIDEEGIENLRNNADEKQSNIQAAKYMAGEREKQLDDEKSLKENPTNYSILSNFLDNLNHIEKIFYTSAVDGSTNLTDDAFDELKDFAKDNEVLIKEVNKKLGYGETDKLIIEANESDEQFFNKYITAIEEIKNLYGNSPEENLYLAREKETQTNNKLTLSALFNGSDISKNEKYDKILSAAAMSDQISLLYDNALKEVQKSDEDDIAEAYKEKYYKGQITSIDKNGNLVDANGEQLASLIQMQSDVAFDRIKGSYEELLNGIANLYENTTSDAVADFITQKDFSGLTKEQIENLNVDEYVTEELAASFGKTREQLIEELKSEKLLYDDAWKEAGSQYMNSITSGLFEEVNQSKKLSIDGKEAVYKLLRDSLLNGGQEAVSATKDFLNQIDDLDAFVKATETIDFNTVKMSEFKDVLKDAGINISNITDDSFANFINACKDLDLIIKDATESFKALNGALSGKDLGDSIDAEAYNKLPEFLQKFFGYAADGTYQLLVTAEELARAAEGVSASGFVKNISNILSLDVGYLEKIQNNLNNLYNQKEIDSLKELIGTSPSNSSFGYLQNILDAKENDLVDYFKKNNDFDTLKTLALSNQNLSQDEITTISEAVDADHLTTDAAKVMAKAISEITQQDLEEAYEQNSSQYASTASNIGELKAFNNTTYEGSDSKYVSDEDYIKYLDVITEKTAEVNDLDFEDIVAQGKDLEETYKLDTASARELAIQNQLMNRGIESLVENWEDWKTALNENEKGTTDYAKTVKEVSSAIADLVGYTGTLSLSNNFLSENFEDIEAAAEGDIDAINRLGIAVGKDLVNAMQQTVFEDSEGNLLNIDFEAIKENITNGLNDILQNLELGKINAGQEISASWIDDLNTMAMATEMTVDEMNNLLNTIGMTADVVVDYKQVTHKVPAYRTVHHVTGNPNSGEEWSEWTETIPEPGQEATITENIPVAQINTNGDTSTPKIKYVGNATPSTSTTSGNKDKSSSSSSKKNKKHIDDTPDVYHDIERSIKRVEDAMKKLDKAQSHLYGKQLIDSLKQQNALLDEQYDNYTKLAEIAASEKDRLQKELGGYGVVFGDQTGEMQNYAEAYSNMIKWYNGEIDKYNASAKEEADEERLTAAKEEYDKFKQLLSDYDKALDKQLEAEQSRLEIVYEQIENNFKAWETEITVTLDLSEAKQEWTKFWQKVNSDIRATYKDYAKELGNITENFDLRSADIATDLKAVQDIQRDLDLFSTNRDNPDFHTEMFASETDAANALLEYSNKLRDDAESLYDTYAESWDKYLEGIDQVIDKWGDVLDEFDKVNDSLEHHAKVIELLYADGALAKSLNDQIYDIANANNLSQLSVLRQQGEELTKQRQALLEQGASATDEDVKKLTDAIEDNQKAMESAIENFIESCQKQFENSINMAREGYEKALTNGSTLAKVSEQWEDAQHAAEGYYDDVERVYELDAMSRKWQDAIDSAKTLKAQQKLKDLMDAQLENLESKTELTEHDIELAEKQLAVAQAQVDLEDAQNNKNTMKLVRNEQGNWSYQYVVDGDDVAEKQKDLIDKTHEWYEYSKQAYKELLESWTEEETNYIERITELEKLMLTQSEEDKAATSAEIARIEELYNGEDGILTHIKQKAAQYEKELNASVVNDLSVLYQTDKTNLENMTEAEKDIINSYTKDAKDKYQVLHDAIAGDEGFYNKIKDKCEDVNKESIEYWDTAAKHIVDSWVDDDTSVKNAIEDFYEACGEAQEKYDDLIDKGTEASGQNYAELSTYVEGLKGRIAEATSQTSDLVDETNQIGALKSTVDNLRDSWNQVASSIDEVTKRLNEYLTPLTEAAYLTSMLKDGGTVSFDATSLNNFVNQINTTAAEIANKIKGFKRENEDPSIIKKTKTGWSGGGKYFQDKEAGLLSNPAHLDTGGYTGSWNDGSGKFAVLHSKELVLNAEDTKNMLEAVNVVRSITNLGQSVASSISTSLANMMQGLSGLYADYLPVSSATLGDYATTNQFNITAEFPNANNVDDIREAILSLPNLAGQYLAQRSL